MRNYIPEKMCLKVLESIHQRFSGFHYLFIIIHLYV